MSRETAKSANITCLPDAMMPHDRLCEAPPRDIIRNSLWRLRRGIAGVAEWQTR